MLTGIGAAWGLKPIGNRFRGDGKGILGDKSVPSSDWAKDTIKLVSAISSAKTRMVWFNIVLLKTERTRGCSADFA